MKFKDYFSRQSEIYAKYRPKYPDELFKFLASLVPNKEVVWDCATGNGQAAVSLAKYFKRVIATDGSPEQIKNAVPHERVKYSVALADNSGIEPNVADLVTIAAALHWMDFDKFYREVNRVLKPGGVFAVWTYCDNHVDNTIDGIVKQFSREILADYWPPETKYVFNHYSDIPFPFKEIPTPEFATTINGDLNFLIGYLHSWSSTQRYMKATDKDPVELIRKKLEDAWGDAKTTKEIKWDIVMKAGSRIH